VLDPSELGTAGLPKDREEDGVGGATLFYGECAADDVKLTWESTTIRRAQQVTDWLINYTASQRSHLSLALLSCNA